VAAVGLAINNAVDPTGAKFLTAKQQTAVGRGLDPSKVPATGGFGQINVAGDWFKQHASDGTLTTRPTAGYQDRLDAQIIATQANTAALKLAHSLNASQKLTPAQAEAIRAADRKARGVGIGPFKKSDITPRLSFLGANHPGGKDVTVASALVLGFETGKGGAAFRSTPDLKRSIDVLVADQKQLLVHGDTHAARAIGADIVRLKLELAKRTADAAAKTARAAQLAGMAAAQATRDKNLSVTAVTNVNVNVTAGGVQRIMTFQRRYGPASGSKYNTGSGLGPGGA